MSGGKERITQQEEENEHNRIKVKNRQTKKNNNTIHRRKSKLHRRGETIRQTETQRNKHKIKQIPNNKD